MKNETKLLEDLLREKTLNVYMRAGWQEDPQKTVILLLSLLKEFQEMTRKYYDMRQFRKMLNEAAENLNFQINPPDIMKQSKKLVKRIDGRTHEVLFIRVPTETLEEWKNEQKEELDTIIELPRKRKLKEEYKTYLNQKKVRNLIAVLMDVSDDTIRRWLRNDDDILENINILNILWLALPKDKRPRNLYGLLEPQKNIL